MKVIINRESKELPDQSTVAQLKEQMSIPSAGTAIAVNGKLVRAADHATYILREGDDIVIIGAAYGG